MCGVLIDEYLKVFGYNILSQLHKNVLRRVQFSHSRLSYHLNLYGIIIGLKDFRIYFTPENISPAVLKLHEYSVPRFRVV